VTKPRSWQCWRPTKIRCDRILQEVPFFVSEILTSRHARNPFRKQAVRHCLGLLARAQAHKRIHKNQESLIMKYKMLTLILALTVVSWAQTETQTAPATPQQSTAPAEKAKCACCDKMAAGDMKDMKSCCARHDMQAKDGKDGKEMASCCSGKDAKICMRNSKDKTAASCCKEGCSKESCGKDKTASCCGDKCGKDGKGCCSKMEKTAKMCCERNLRG
jgi:hypothetical protein